MGGSRELRAIASDPKARQAAVNTIYYTALFVPISILASLFIAHALNRKIAFVRFYRLAVFIPVVTSTIATGIMFLWLFDRNYGLANWLLGKVGLGPFGFFEEPNQAMIALVLMTVWGWLGFDTIIYLAALQGVPAGADGGGGDRRREPVELVLARHVADARPGDAAARRVVDDQRAPAVRRGVLRDQGRPLGRTSVVVFYVYRLAFEQGLGGLSLAGYAAAIAYVLFLVILVLTLAQFWLGRRVVHYPS